MRYANCLLNVLTLGFKVSNNIGDKISYNDCQYYVLEIGNNAEGNLQELIIGK